MFKKIGMFMSLAAAFALAAVGQAHAAADTDLAAALASSTTMVTDNKSQLLTFIVGIGVVVLVIGLAKGGVILAIKWVKKSVAGCGKRK